MRRAWFWLALLPTVGGALAGCEKVDSGPVDNLNGGRIEIVGHAGSGFESALNPYPSNTLTSIRRTVEGYNADGVEMDVQLSADSVLILYHNETLESMTACDGYVSDKLAADVTGCRYRTDFNSHILQDEYLLRLEDIMSRYAGSGFRPALEFDLKEPSPGVNATQYRRRLARQLALLVRRYPQLDHLTFEGGTVETLLAVKAAIPTAKTLFDSDDFAQAKTQCLRHGFSGIVARNSALTKEQVAEAHAAGLWVALYQMVRRPEILEAVNKNPDAVQTDNILLTQQMVAARY